MKAYIYILSFLLLCSCGIRKKAMVKAGLDVTVENVKTESSSASETSVTDTSKVETEEMVVTEVIAPKEDNAPVIRRNVSYRRTISHNGISSKGSEKEYNIHNNEIVKSKISVSKTDIKEAKAGMPAWKIIFALCLPFMAVIAVMVLYRVENREK